MAKTIRAFIHECDDSGKRTAPARRVFAMLATNNNPAVLTIEIPDSRKTRHREINITIAELRRALRAVANRSAT